jgi:hypothetical protein
MLFQEKDNKMFYLNYETFYKKITTQLQDISTNTTKMAQKLNPGLEVHKKSILNIVWFG